MQPATDPCVSRYRELKNLKLVGAELGIPWQTVYTRLKRAGEPVTGDKARYGSETDRLAARAERWFQKLVPHAEDQNALGFQTKVDFRVCDRTVDVKVSRARKTKRGFLQWSWSVKKQESVADYFVCIALSGEGDDLKVYRALLVPGDLARFQTTLRASNAGNGFYGKWSDYAVSPAELSDFFKEPA